MDSADAVRNHTFRSRVADFLFGLAFPATRAQIIRRASHNNTASQINDALLALPDRSYSSLEDVLAAVNYYPEHHWDVDGFPAAAERHDQAEAARIAANIQRAARPTPPPYN